MAKTKFRTPDRAERSLLNKHRDFDAILEDWPRWSSTLKTAPILIKDFLQGKTNKSYLLKSELGKIVLRINADNSQELGLNRAQEISFHRAASEADLAPALIYTDPDERYIVKYYAEGQIWCLGNTDEIRRQQIFEIAKKFAEIHNLPLKSEAIDYLEIARNYWQQIEFTNSDFSDLILPLFSQIEHFFQDFQKNLGDTKPCHHDPVVENLINTQKGLQIIDWEYATRGSPWFDLVVFADSAKLNEAQTQELIEQYSRHANFLGDGTTQYKHALKSFHYLDLLWHCVQGYNVNVLSKKLSRCGQSPPLAT